MKDVFHGARQAPVAIAIAALFYAAPGMAEEIQGMVKDALGRPLAGVGLSLQGPGGEVVGKAKTDAEGHFVFNGITSGAYAVLGEKPGFKTESALVQVTAGSNATAEMTLASTDALELTVTAARLNKARNSLSPKTGGSVYHFNADDVAAMPEGGNTSFNQVLLQAPGVANDSYGQLHIRGDHANTQYRINGVILPEGVSGFGQALDTRFAERIDLMTGALPAQYGYRTAGVIEIDTKNRFDAGGRVDYYGGSHDTSNPSFEYGNTNGNLSYYVTGSFMRNNLGIENPTGSTNAIHDKTEQTKEFAYLSYLVNPETRISAMFGSYDGRFQIPNNPGQPPDPNGNGFIAASPGGFNSANLNETQHEQNQYGIVALQSSLGPNFDYQLAFFSRYTSVDFRPDPIGDLVFNGVAAKVFRSSFSNGIQGDGSYRLNDTHTVRMGMFASTEDIRSNNTSTVFPVDNAGNVTGAPFTIVDNNPKNGNRLFGLYVQDEWKTTDKLTINYGLRLDKLQAFVDEGQLSPRLGLVYKATPDTTFHAGYSRYFTPPPTELIASKTLALFAGTSNAPSSNQDSPVKSERSNYFDAGVTQQVSKTTSLGVDAFYKDIKNLIDEGQFGQALIFTPFNYAKGKIYGIELSANYRDGNVSAYANLARTTSLAKQITSAEFNFGQDELDYIASHWVHVDHDQALTASAGASYLWQGTTLSTDAFFGSGLRSGFANTDHLPAYVQVNVGASRKWQTTELGNIETRVSVINLFDKVYEIRDGSGIGVGAPQFGPRRGLYVGLSKLF